MKGYQELLIWQRARELVKSTYLVSAKLPVKEQYGLISQINRCAVSIPSNIAEGWSRNSTKDFVKFLGISRGSLAELETQIIISNDLGYISEEDFLKIQEKVSDLGRMLSAAISKLKNRVVLSKLPVHNP